MKSNPTPNLPADGDIIAGKYRVERLLGVGGMGAVVAARHLVLGQRVAIKMLLPEALRLPEACTRFLREAQAVVALRSEHVARVLDMGSSEHGAPYLVMEHLDGTDFARILRERKRLPISEAIEVLMQACEAITEAHKLGIIHRDLKPANLFRTQAADGSPLIKVLDFGLSKFMDRDSSLDAALTATGMVAGSPSYMSPEQIRSLKRVDGRTDIWALGVILYEFIAGARPYRGNNFAAICASIVSDPLPGLNGTVPEIPPEFEAVLATCLHKDPDRRFQTIADFAAQLMPFATPDAQMSIARILRVESTRDAITLLMDPKTEPFPTPTPEPVSIQMEDVHEVPTVRQSPGNVTSNNGTWGQTNPKIVHPGANRRKLVAGLGTIGIVGLIAGIAVQKKTEVPMAERRLSQVPESGESLPNPLLSPPATASAMFNPPPITFPKTPGDSPRHAVDASSSASKRREAAPMSSTMTPPPPLQTASAAVVPPPSPPISNPPTADTDPPAPPPTQTAAPKPNVPAVPPKPQDPLDRLDP